MATQKNKFDDKRFVMQSSVMQNADWALENLKVIRILMEGSAIYRRALAPVMGVVGVTGIAAGILGAILRLETPQSFSAYWVAVAFVCLTEAFFMIRRQAIRTREPIWSPPTRRVAQALLPAFIAGLAAGIVFFYVARPGRTERLGTAEHSFAHTHLDDLLWAGHACGRVFPAAETPDFRLGIYWLRAYCSWLFDRSFQVAGCPAGGRSSGQYCHGRIIRWRTCGLRLLPLLYGTARKCCVNTKPFLQLDRVIHEKGRLPIVSLLAASPELSFTDLRDTLKMTDGNLSMHIKTLQEAGFVSVTKSFQRQRPLTTCSLTPAGRKAFASYIDLLEEIVRQARSKK